MADDRNDNFGKEGENAYDRKRRRMKTTNLVLLVVGCVVLVFAIVFSSVFVSCYGFRLETVEDDVTREGTYTVEVDDSDDFDQTEYYSNGLCLAQNSKNSYAVVGVGEEYPDEVDIPSTYNGLAVTVIESSAFENSTVKTVSIPNSVTDIGDYAFRNCSSLEAVYIPMETSHIGSEAFGGCHNLLIFAGANSLPSGWSSDWNPEGCSVYWNISGMPTNNVTFTFVTGGGSEVESISARWLSELPTSTREGYALYGWYTDQNFSGESIVSVPYYSADDVTLYARWLDVSTQSEGLRVEDDVITGIGTCTDSILVLYMPVSAGAFAGNNQITDIYLMDVQYVSDSAFRQCLSLTGITIGESTTSIGNNAFYGCTALSKVAYNATDMDDFSSENYVFYNAGHDGSGIAVTVGANVTKIPAYIFCPSTSSSSSEYAPKVSRLVFEDGSRCEVIGGYSFYNCISLTSIEIVESVTTVEDYAFYKCTYLTEIAFNATSANDFSYNNCVFEDGGQDGAGITLTIGSNVTRIPAYIFSPYTGSSSIYLAPKIISVIFEEGSQCESIGTYAFNHSRSLTSISIPENVTNIDARAFSGCTALNEIIFDSTCMDDLSSSDNVFYNAGLYSSGIAVTIGANVTKIPAYLFKVGASNAPNITSVIFEEGSLCESIGEYAFYYCSALMSITIVDSVKTIGDNAFYRCTALTEINYNAISLEDLSPANGIFYCAGNNGSGITLNVGANVKRIPAYLLDVNSNSSGAPNITNVIFEEGCQCESIGNYAFAYCASLTSIEVPDSVTSIGEYAFYGCMQLESVTIGENVASIGYGAFVDCSSLIVVYYMGTAEEWDEILIDNLNYNLTNVSRYYYSEASNTDGSHWHYVNGKPVIW